MAVVLSLTACSNSEPEEKITVDGTDQEDNYEVLSEKDYEIELYDNNDLNITLNKSRHEREDAVQDWMKLMVTVNNKTDKTYDFYFEEITLDGNVYKVTNITSTDTEIKPNEELEVIVVVDSLEEISFDEHVSGQLVYNDYEKNRSVAEFSSYINE